MWRANDVSRWRWTVVFLISFTACTAKHGDDSDTTDASSSGAEESDAGLNPIVPDVVGQCPLDIRERVPAPDCSGPYEDSEGKWSEADALIWQSVDGPNRVRIEIRGGLVTCPETDESGAVSDFRMKWNEQAQLCVHMRIEEVGGTVNSAALQTSVIYAELNWEQVQEIGKLPQVGNVTNVGFPPTRD